MSSAPPRPGVRVIHFQFRFNMNMSLVNDVFAKRQSSIPMRSANMSPATSCVHIPAAHAPKPVRWFSHAQTCVPHRLRGSTRSSSAQKATSSDPAVASTASDGAPRSGRMTYKPESFGEMVDDAVASVQAGLKDGFLQMEVEFPPVPVALDGAFSLSPKDFDADKHLHHNIASQTILQPQRTLM